MGVKNIIVMGTVVDSTFYIISVIPCFNIFSLYTIVNGHFTFYPFKWFDSDYKITCLLTGVCQVEGHVVSDDGSRDVNGRS